MNDTKKNNLVSDEIWHIAVVVVVDDNLQMRRFYVCQKNWREGALLYRRFSCRCSARCNSFGPRAAQGWLCQMPVFCLVCGALVVFCVNADTTHCGQLVVTSVGLLCKLLKNSCHGGKKMN